MNVKGIKWKSLFDSKSSRGPSSILFIPWPQSLNHFHENSHFCKLTLKCEFNFHLFINFIRLFFFTLLYPSLVLLSTLNLSFEDFLRTRMHPQLNLFVSMNIKKQQPSNFFLNFLPQRNHPKCPLKLKTRLLPSTAHTNLRMEIVPCKRFRVWYTKEPIYHTPTPISTHWHNYWIWFVSYPEGVGRVLVYLSHCIRGSLE